MNATMEQGTAQEDFTSAVQQDPAPSSTPTKPTSRKRSISSARSTTSTLTDPGTSTPVTNSPAQAFAILDGVPPAKKPKLTYAEQEEKRLLKEVRDSEKVEEKGRKEADRKRREFEKAQKDAEREQKRIIRQAEKAEKEKEKAAKHEEKRKKEDEKQKIEEERKKKEQKQPKLTSFLEKPKSTTPSETSPANPTKQIVGVSKYEETFRPFHLFPHVTLAVSPYESERWGSANAADDLDKFLIGEHILKNNSQFDASYLFNCPDLCLIPRGKKITPVREIMAQVYGGSKKLIDLTTDSQNTQIQHTRKRLKQVPYKFLQFHEDVRPAYHGTKTSLPLRELKRLARNPMKRSLRTINYDYDSEAEWVDEAEDGEDIQSDDEEEEEIEDDDDADGFLDDTEDQVANMKVTIQGDLEPKSTGLSWEDERGRAPILRLYGYHMELMIENIKDNTPIDPFSTSYWESAVSVTAPGCMDPPRIPLHAMKSTSSMVNAPRDNTLKMFGITNSQKTAAQPATSKPTGKLVAPEDMALFRSEVQGSELSKIGLIEVLYKKMTSKASNKAAVKYTLDTLAKRVGHKEADKKWVLKDDSMT